ncbi:MAG: zinc ribbon domain-containing protein [Spirochaetaceae bacterium]|nr:zinc ribbon domain-containing protein [Spirochaetaceae bacterium]
MRFVAEPIRPEAALDLIKGVHWEYPFKTDYERYLLVSDYSGALPIQERNRNEMGVIILLGISSGVCESVTLLKQNRRMLNYFDLLETLNTLPVREYRFRAEKRLGNKYRFITQLLGGWIHENYDGFYYHIVTAVARRRFYMKTLREIRREYGKICGDIQKILCETAREIQNEIQGFAETLSLMPTEKTQYFHKRFQQFIGDAEDGITKVLDDRINEKNEECAALLDYTQRQELDRYIKNVIANQTAAYYKNLEDLSAEASAYLEFIKDKEVAEKRFKASLIERERNEMQRRFYKPAPYEECFAELDLLHQFLNGNEGMPKQKAETCKGCAHWKEEKRFCALYQCGIEKIPFFSTKCWTLETKKAEPPRGQRHEPAQPSQKIQEKCGGCAFYVEEDTFCRWLKAEISETIAGCTHYKTVREQFPYCIACGRRLNTADKFCVWCGAAAYREKAVYQAQNTLLYCSSCGSLMKAGDHFCGYCGNAAYYGKK